MRIKQHRCRALSWYLSRQLWADPSSMASKMEPGYHAKWVDEPRLGRPGTAPLGRGFPCQCQARRRACLGPAGSSGP